MTTESLDRRIVAVDRFADPDAMNRLVRQLHVDEAVTSGRPGIVIDVGCEHELPFGLDAD